LSTATRSAQEQEQENTFLDDGKGHINPELATRIYKWEQEQRVNLNLPEFQHSTTRQGLRWVLDIVAEQQSASDKKFYDDFIQEGVIALMQAMMHYEHDASPQESYEAFAKQQIRRALEAYSVTSRQTRKTLSMESTVEIKDSLETHYSNQDEWEVREGLVLDNGSSVDKEALVENFLDPSLQYEGEDQMWVHQQQVADPLKDSIPDPIAAFVFGEETMTPDDLALTDMIRYNVDEFLGSTLEDLESQIIQMRFGLEDGELPKTTKEVAFELDLSVSKVRKLQKSALEKLRNAYSDRYVDEDDYSWEDTV
jgi:RNA polymerase sigma factor (sigma-70 family)